MKYNEAKKAIQQLHAAGWQKHRPGFPFYHKKWKLGMLDYNQLLSFDEIIYSAFEIDWILQKYEEKAEHNLRQAMSIYSTGGEI